MVPTPRSRVKLTPSDTSSAMGGATSLGARLPSELIERLFSVANFSQSDATALARVSRNSTWQRCVNEVLWTLLAVKLCEMWTENDKPKLSSAQCHCYVHKLKTQPKVRALLSHPEKARFVRHLDVMIAESCYKVDCRLLHPFTALLCAFPLQSICIHASDSDLFPVKMTLDTLAASSPELQLSSLQVYLDAKASSLTNNVRLTATRENASAELVRHPAFATGLPPPSRLNRRTGTRTRKQLLSVPTVIISSRTLHAFDAIDLDAATSLTLHGHALDLSGANLKAHTLHYLVVLDVTFTPERSNMLSFVSRDAGLVKKLGRLASLRRLTIRFDTPDELLHLSHEACLQLQFVRQHLHDNYPPGLEHLAFKVHSPQFLSPASLAGFHFLEDGAPPGPAPFHLVSAKNFAFDLLFRESLPRLATALSTTFMDLKSLELPVVPFDLWQEAQSVLDSLAGIRNWRHSPGHQLILTRGPPPAP